MYSKNNLFIKSSIGDICFLCWILVECGHCFLYEFTPEVSRKIFDKLPCFYIMVSDTVSISDLWLGRREYMRCTRFPPQHWGTPQTARNNDIEIGHQSKPVGLQRTKPFSLKYIVIQFHW